MGAVDAAVVEVQAFPAHRAADRDEALHGSGKMSRCSIIFPIVRNMAVWSFAVPAMPFAANQAGSRPNAEQYACTGGLCVGEADPRLVAHERREGSWISLAHPTVRKRANLVESAWPRWIFW